MQLLLEEPAAGTAIQLDHGMSDDEFYRFCQINPNLRIERSAEGDIIVMPPVGGESSFRNSEITIALGAWARRDGRGRSFDSSVEYILPNRAALSPDASWALHTRLDALTKEQKRKFLPLCPDFVIELMSPSDRLPKMKAKMQEWIDNGAQLGWLLDPDHRTAYIYRPGQEPELLLDPQQLTGEAPVAGFVLELADIWAGL